MPTIVLVAFAVRDEKVFMVSSSPFEFALRCAMLAASCHLQIHVKQSELVRSPRWRAEHRWQYNKAEQDPGGLRALLR